MKTTARFSAALLPLTLAASVAHADIPDAPGTSFEGTGETLRGVSVAVLPPVLIPRSMPTVEDLSIITEVGREILGEEALRERFGAFTLAADGSVSRTPASDPLIRRILSGE